MWQTAFVAVLAIALPSQARLSSIGGVVTLDGEPVPGVTITVVGPQISRTTVTGSNGEYQAPPVPDGRYRVSSALPGFRDETRDVVLVGEARVDFALRVGVMAEVLRAVPSLADAPSLADNVVRLRIERELPPEPCGQVATAIHVATVIESIRFPFPSQIRFGLDSAGTCLDGAARIKGMHPALRSGDEYVVFLVQSGNHFESVGGRMLMFPVENGRILTGDHPQLPPPITSLAEFLAAVRRLAR